MKRFANLCLITLLATLLAACTAMSTSIEHRDLAVSTKMSDSIFVTPASQAQRTVYIQARNTSDRADFSFNQPLKLRLAAEGYTIVDNVDSAHYLLQTNVLKIEKMSPDEVDSALSGGFGGAVLGGVTGSVISGGDSGSTLAGAVVGSIASTAANSLIKNINIVAIVDIQLSERTKDTVTQSSRATLSQGSNTTEKQTTSTTTNWKRYRTRVVSTANKVNLTYADAKPALETALANSISGVL